MPLSSSIVMGISVLIIGLMFGMMDTILPIFTIQELGWTNTTYSEIYASSSIIGGFLGLFIGGALVDFFGKRRMASIYLIFLILSIGSFAILPQFWHEGSLIYLFIVTYYVGYTFLNIAVFAICMQLCLGSSSLWKLFICHQQFPEKARTSQ